MFSPFGRRAYVPLLLFIINYTIKSSLCKYNFCINFYLVFPKQGLHLCLFKHLYKRKQHFVKAVPTARTTCRPAPKKRKKTRNGEKGSRMLQAPFSVIFIQFVINQVCFSGVFAYGSRTNESPRSLYPTPHTVSITAGHRASGSSFFLSRLICTVSVALCPRLSYPHTASISSSFVKTVSGCSIRYASNSRSFLGSLSFFSPENISPPSAEIRYPSLVCCCILRPQFCISLLSVLFR